MAKFKVYKTKSGNFLANISKSSLRKNPEIKRSLQNGKSIKYIDIPISEDFLKF